MSITLRKLLKPFLGRGLGKVPGVRLGYRLMVKLFSPITVYGHTLYLDPTDSLELLLNPIIDPFETEILKKEIKSGDTVMNLGANIGYHVLLMARLAGEQGKVYAFEPHPGHFQILQKNVEVNGYKNIVLVQKALLDENKTIFLFLDTRKPADHRTYDPNKNLQAVKVEAIRLDDYLDNQEAPIHFIKLNVMGAEGKALQGMKNILERNPELKMTIKFYPEFMERPEKEYSESLHILDSCGFQLFTINQEQEKLEPIQKNEFSEITTEKTRRMVFATK